MSFPVIGWERTTPVPEGYAFNDYLHMQRGRLFYEDLDLAQLLIGRGTDQGLGRVLPSPLEIVYLPRIRENIARLQQAFLEAGQQVGYAGKFLYTYASKANEADEVVRTVLDTGVDYEISSAVDVEIALLEKASGHLTPERLIICNGFKQPGTLYAQNIVRLRQVHEHVIPVVEDLIELQPLIESGLPFEVGLRQKSYGSEQRIEAGGTVNSRFGMDEEQLWQAAETVSRTPDLSLKLLHAMVGSQILSAEDFIRRLLPSIDLFARLCAKYPSLHIFDYGGGIPAPLTLNFDFDYRDFAVRLYTELAQACGRYGVPVPDVMGEMGRYTVAEHGAHLFKVLSVKENHSPLPWYIINGSIMSSLPDVWALSEHFILLPLNHLDRPFQRVQLGGITCDSDDVYPPESSGSALYLPVETKDLYIGFFAIGAYQEMLGGVGGSKHCVIPEATELIIDRESAGGYSFKPISGQNTEKVLRNLGYAYSASTSIDP